VHRSGAGAGRRRATRQDAGRNLGARAVRDQPAETGRVVPKSDPGSARRLSPLGGVVCATAALAASVLLPNHSRPRAGAQASPAEIGIADITRVTGVTRSAF